ncbi:MAG: ATP synthase F1 subunit epsilon [Anaerolineaceae bacterium 4572_78]|nr:MAG: ATP synthase F1 subunit epsilon [Anaerolineaceae bacterium 4572_78]
MGTIRLDIVTVERELFSDDVDMVVAPGSEGVMGILSNHVPLLTSLNVGELVVHKKGQEDIIFAIGDGFMDVQPCHVTILADVAEQANEINMERAKAAHDKAEKAIASGSLSAGKLRRAEASLKRASLRMKVAEKYGK